MTFHEDGDNVLLARVRAASEDVALTPEARERIARRLARGASGATTLREAPLRRSTRTTAWIAAAAVILIGFLVWPMLDRSTTLSAAEVLGRSQQALVFPGTGVESVTYDLLLGGVLEELLPIEQSGRFTVVETIDHDHHGRYKVVKLGPDGRMMAGLVEDPVAGTRAWYVVLDGRGRLLRAAHAQPAIFSFVEARTFALQTLIGMMQASNSAALQETVRSGEPAYAVDVPGDADASGPITLARGRAVIAKSDWRLLDFEAEGAIAGRPFSITFNLRSRSHEVTAPQGAFSLTAGQGDQVIDLPGNGPADMLSLVGRCLQQ
jgi:hypothetical protein